MSSNPYAAPKAAVGDVEVEQEYQEVQLWSANGRIGRLRYLAYSLGSVIILSIIAGALAAVLGESMATVVAVVAYIAMAAFGIITTIKRSHDMDWNGWTWLLTLIPFVGLIWLFKSGTEGSNSYGAPPPPNTTGVKVLAFLFLALFVLGIIGAIALPMMMARTSGM